MEPSAMPRPSPDEARVLPRPQCHPAGESQEQASARFMRLTVNAAPASTAALTASGLTFGAVIQPLAPPRLPGEGEVPVVSFGTSGVVRCRRCRTYINPFVQWTDGGRRWKCNMCYLINEVASDYFGPLDSYGRRTDAGERPELSQGTVEFVASADYMVRPPQPPVYVFLLDLSYHAVSTGAVEAVAAAVLSVLDALPGDERTQFALLGYDSAVHYFNLSSKLAQFQTMVVPDIDDIFLPMPEDMLVNLADSKEQARALLEKLPRMCAETQNLDAALGPALKAAFQLMQHVGGKLHVFSATLPNVGEARVRNREDARGPQPPKRAGVAHSGPARPAGAAQSNLLLPEEGFYKKLAVECSRQQICVDCWFTGAVYADVVTIGQLAKHTGGAVHYYPAFSAPRDGAALAAELTHNLTREQGWEAVMRVRVSQGVKISSFHGHFFVRGTDLLALPNVDADKAFGITLALEENALTSTHVAVQSALLYTTSEGERRIRVSTACVPVVASVAELHKLVDVDAVTSLTAKLAAEKALGGKLDDGRELVQAKALEAINGFRSVCPADARRSSALILSEPLRLLPLHALGLMKHAAFRPEADVRADERAAALMRLQYLGVLHAVPAACPRVMPLLLDLRPPLGAQNPATGLVNLPPLLPNASDRTVASPHGVFLVENGSQLLMWVGQSAPPAFLSDVFGRPTLADGQPAVLAPRSHHPAADTVANICEALQAERGGLLAPLRVVPQGSAEEALVLRCLTEERTVQMMSYDEFLVHLMRTSQAKVP